MAEVEPPAGDGTPPKVLRRSREDRVISGVAGGLGRYFGIDPVLVRVAFVIVAIMGAGLVAYLLLWLVIPEERGGERLGPAPRSTGLSGPMVLGIVLIAVGVLSLVSVVIPGRVVLRFLVPSLLIVIGLGVIVMGTTRDR